MKVIPKPLDPPATDAELNRAAKIWTEAQDIMVERGFARHFWGMLEHAGHEAMVLMLRQADRERDRP